MALGTGIHFHSLPSLSRPVGQRSAIVVAGPAANFLLAIIIFTIFIFTFISISFVMNVEEYITKVFTVQGTDNVNYILPKSQLLHFYIFITSNDFTKFKN